MSKNKKEDNLFKVRHSLCHIMSMAVLDVFGHDEVGLGVGPVIENGFYQDYDLRGQQINEEMFEDLERRMRDMIKKEMDFVQAPKSIEDSLFLYTADEYKKELIEDLQKSGESEMSFYKSDWYDNLCKGPHVANTNVINPHAFKLMSVAGSYWRGDSDRQMLTRIYGVAFNTKKELDAYLKMLEEAKKRDHKVLGPKFDLFTFSELVGAGLPLWTPKGTILRNSLDDYVWELRKSCGYQKVEIPHITKKDLYIKSGHWDKFKDQLFRITTREGHEFAMKPMNCPHHTQIYAARQRSYRDLPERFANTTMVYRDEQSGELAGLSRVRSITQDDAHVFCRKAQVKDEMLKIWNIIDEFYKTVGFGDLDVRLSLHDPENFKNYLGTPDDWALAEQQLRNLVKERGVDAKEEIGEAAFYGPKIDFIGKDSIGREWQVATIQLDFNMPESFDLSCINEEGQKERIVMIHAAIMGSIERFLSILIEHFAAAFPVWLAPVQVKIVSVADRHIDKVNELAATIDAIGGRFEIDTTSETIGKKIRKAAELKTPYTIVVGDKEVEGGDLQIKVFGTKQQLTMPESEFIKYLADKISSRELEY